MIFRLMAENDYKGIYDLWINTPGMGLNSADDSKEGFKKYLTRNPSTSFVALDGEKIVGVIMAGHDGRRGYIYHTAVLPEYRGNHIGKKLVDLAMAALEKEGINKVALVVFDNNDTGNKFWESQGFTTREDLIYRNKNIHELTRIDT
jgi:ribosomal protein S18 acetylase RimI-like enzyme